MFQFAGVKVSGLFTVASPVSLDTTVRTTSEVGWAFRTMVKVSVVPVSATVVDPPDCAMVKPATSSSVVVADRVWFATGSKSLSELASSTAIVMVEVMVPSMMLSSTPVTAPSPQPSQLLLMTPTVSLEVTVKATFDAGWALRTTVKVSVVPVSATAVDPPD